MMFSFMNDEPEWNDLPRDWGDMEAAIFADFAQTDMDIWDDPYVRGHFHDGLFAFYRFDNEVMTDKLNELRTYLMNEYGLDFDAIFDWASYREWYG